MKRHVNVLGVGMTQFKTPKNADPYTVMGQQAGQLALADAGLDYREVEQAYVGYVYGDSTAGQRVVYELGMSGIPVFNVNNNCATGSSATTRTSGRTFASQHVTAPTCAPMSSTRSPASSGIVSSW